MELDLSCPTATPELDSSILVVEEGEASKDNILEDALPFPSSSQCTDIYQGSFDPFFCFYLSPIPLGYFLVCVSAYLFNSTLQGIRDVLENLRRGTKVGSQNAEDSGKDARDSFPFDKG